MAYKIVLNERAKNDLQAIYDDDSGRYTRAEQLVYVREIRRLIKSLNPFPKRSTPMVIRGREYRRIMFKAHTVFFRVIDADNTVYIDAVIHSHMDFKRHL